jgi:RNA polymerase sigma-70 factor (ECF subfamily)
VNKTKRTASKSVHEEQQTEPDDLALVLRCQRGDRVAFGVLVERYRQRVYGLVYGMLRNEQDAFDLSQDTFVKAWQAIGSFQRNCAFYTWLYRIATNLCIDFVRKRQRRPTVAFEEAIDPEADVNVEIPASKQGSPPDEARRRELREQIDAALMELSPEHRVIIQLRELDGLEYAEIARVVGCNIGTVMSRLFYARKNLQKLLKEVI